MHQKSLKALFHTPLQLICLQNTLVNFRNLPYSLGQHWKIFGRLQFNFGSAKEVLGRRRKSSSFFPPVRLRVKALIRFDGEDVSSIFSSWGGEGGVVRYRGVIKEKSPDLDI